jgi:inner membrane protein
MDSVTQFALGACVGVAVLGRKIGPRRAALTGGILGTLPDLDVFLAPEDPIESFVQHRGWTHSLIVHAALTPIIGEALRSLVKSLRDDRVRAYAAVFLCLTTHALLDAMTIYGTRLFWPLSTEPVGVGSIFIIDPLYTLPLIVAMIWAAFAKSMTQRYGKALAVCLGLSSLYLGWTAIAQYWMTDRANALLADAQITPSQMIAIPTPFNSFVWRVIGLDGDRYFNLYQTVFGGPSSSTFYSHDRKLAFAACDANRNRIAKVADFSDGYYRLMVQNDTLLLADLRMGLTPDYAFRFVIGRFENGKLVPAPLKRLERQGNIRADLDWLFATMPGKAITRFAEASARTELKRYAAARGTSNRIGHC